MGYFAKSCPITPTLPIRLHILLPFIDRSIPTACHVQSKAARPVESLSSTTNFFFWIERLFTGSFTLRHIRVPAHVASCKRRLRRRPRRLRSPRRGHRRLCSHAVFRNTFGRRYAQHLHAFANPFVTGVNGMMCYVTGNATSHSGGSTLSLAAGVDGQHQGPYYHIPSGMSLTDLSIPHKLCIVSDRGINNSQYFSMMPRDLQTVCTSLPPPSP